MTSGPPPWYLDELAYAGRENLDPRHVAGYDQKEDSGAEAEVAVLLEAGLRPDATVIELGPGTGQLTVVLAPHCRRIIAVDVSPVMIDALRTKIDDLGLSGVEIVRGGFLSYQHDGTTVDVVYSRLALHHLPDFWKVVALQRIRDLLAPGGLFRLVDVVFDVEPAQVGERIEAWRARYGDATDDRWGRSDIDDHVRDEHSTFRWLLEPMLERTGFRVEQSDHAPDAFLSSYLLRAV